METSKNQSFSLSWLGAWGLFHLLVWTALPLLCNTCLPLDSIEAVMWGSCVVIGLR